MSNARGHYGYPPRIGTDVAPSMPPTGSTINPWMIGGLGIAAALGIAVLGSRAAKRPQFSAHDKEVRAWEKEFPGLPWYADQVKASQLDSWERARDHWEQAR